MTVQTALSQVADAIREKTGESAAMGLAEMPEKIQRISGALPSQTVNFWDWDGTCLAAYTGEEAAALTQLPPLPTRPGLVCQGWNWTLAEIQGLGRAVEVGAIYTPDNGRTRLYLHVDSQLRREVPLYFGQTCSQGVTIYWGDGSPGETLAGTGNLTASHRYAALGDYVVELAAAEDCALGLGHGTAATPVVGGPLAVYRSMLYRVQVGAGVPEIGPYAFASCFHVTEITVPATVTSLGGNSFNNCFDLLYACLPRGIEALDAAFLRCYALKRVSLPPSVASVGKNAFNFCYALERVTLSEGVTEIGASAFYNCFSLQELTIPQGVTSMGASALYSCMSLSRITLPAGVATLGSSLLYNCVSLHELTIPAGVTTIVTNACYGCYSLTSLTIPAGVASIGGAAFSGCASMKEYHLASQTPPALAGGTVFSGIPADCVLYVPAGCLQTYQSAAGWSALAGKLREEPIK